MEQYLTDTNAVCNYFSASFPPAGMALMDAAIDAIPNLSIITQIELLCWNTNEATTLNVQNFIADSVVLDISPDVIAHCVALRKGKKIKIPCYPEFATQDLHLSVQKAHFKPPQTMANVIK